METKHRDLRRAGACHDHRTRFHLADADIARSGIENRGFFELEIARAQTGSSRVARIPAGERRLLHSARYRDRRSSGRRIDPKGIALRSQRGLKTIENR